jgi:CheY-like chemotaxis protein
MIQNMCSFLLKKTKVLVVEDYEINCLLMEEMLSHLGTEVKTAKNSEDALSLIKKNTFDIVFMDIQLPGPNGIELTETIRKMEIKQPKIVAYTANSAIGFDDAYLKAGMDFYLIKPVDIGQLEKIINKITKA